MSCLTVHSSGISVALQFFHTPVNSFSWLKGVLSKKVSILTGQQGSKTLCVWIVSPLKWVLIVIVTFSGSFYAEGVKLITKTRLYNFNTLKPHFYIVKLGFTGVYNIFLISAQKHRLWVFLRTAKSMLWAEIWKIFEFFVWKFSIFRWLTFQYIWIGMFS